MRCCVIGAGAAGICVAKHVANISGWSVTVFEQTSSLGGTWVYTEGDCNNKLLNHSSMYKHMKTNLPKEIMGFLDYPIMNTITNTNGESFVRHDYILRYLESYACEFDILRFIKFDHQVIQAKWSIIGWELRVVDAVNNSTINVNCDALFVCNGHYFKPRIPEIAGLTCFRGLVHHSHDYRVPTLYSGLRVACLGAGPSGVDIALEIASAANQVYLCHTKPRFGCKLPENLIQKTGIKSFACNGATLCDDEFILLDAVVFCTGYEYSFPFLDPSLGIKVENNRVTPLYQHLIHIDFPTLIFVGIPFTVLPLPLFDVQVRFALQVLRGAACLPAAEAMRKWETEDYRRRIEDLKLPSHKAHYLGSMQWTYLETLSQLGNMESLVPPVVPKLYEEVGRQRANLMEYKNLKYRLVNRENFVVTD